MRITLREWDGHSMKDRTITTNKTVFFAQSRHGGIIKDEGGSCIFIYANNLCEIQIRPEEILVVLDNLGGTCNGAETKHHQ